jgi:hypothetical protein
MEKFEFGSAEWFASLFSMVQVRLSGADLAGIRWSQSEEFVNPPEHLRRPAAATIGWHLRVADGRVDLLDEPAADANLRVRASYDAILPISRLVFADTPDLSDRLPELQDLLTADPNYLVVGDRAQAPAAVREALGGLHDDLARRTA